MLTTNVSLCISRITGLINDLLSYSSLLGSFVILIILNKSLIIPTYFCSPPITASVMSSSFNITGLLLSPKTVFWERWA